MQKYRLFGDQSLLESMGDQLDILEKGIFVDRSGECYDGQLPKHRGENPAVVRVGAKALAVITEKIKRRIPTPEKMMRPEIDAVSDADPFGGFTSPVSVDVPLAHATQFGGQHWHLTGGDNSFGTATDALFSMGLSAEKIASGGKDIGVVIVDSGVNRTYVDGITNRATYRGGWHLPNVSGLAFPGQANQPYTRLQDMHGNMIARNILKIAPEATIYDAPILPERITDLEAFSSVATVLIRSIELVIALSAQIPFFPQHKHWIVVNAWAASTTMAEPTGVTSYADNRAHLLNSAVIDLATMNNVEVVFAAGNAGAFQPAAFTGPYDRGHMRSIWGCNGLPEVHTIGAVRTDNMSIGASSQGPSRPALAPAVPVNRKPDFAVPSWYCEDTDPSVLNTGTSASCALFSGLLAHIISEGGPMNSSSVSAALDTMSRPSSDWEPQQGRGPVKIP